MAKTRLCFLLMIVLLVAVPLAGCSRQQYPDRAPEASQPETAPAAAASAAEDPGPTSASVPGLANVGSIVAGVRHPVLSNLSLRPGDIRSAVSVKKPEWAEAVVDGRDGPLVLCGERDGRRLVVLAFDPETQPMSRTRVLPVLVRNTVSYLTGDG